MFRITTIFMSALTISSLWASSFPLEDIDPMIHQVLSEFNIPGLAIGIVADGEVVYAKGFGVRDVEKNLPVTNDTLFAIGSCTKAFTSFVTASLVEEGVMGWDQPVIDVLPQFRLSDEHATHHLTFRDLLSHRSGMARHPYMWYNSQYTQQEIFERLRYLEMAWDIRERFNYGDLMYLTTGLAMEKATGKSWQELVTEKILRPLGMDHTTFSAQETQATSDFALPYIEKEGKCKQMEFRDLSNIGPAATMSSSLQDLLAWVKMLLAGGSTGSKALLSSGSLQEMFGSQVIASSYTESKDILLSAYGLGWFIHPYRGHYSVSHDGGLDGFTSVVSLIPNSNIGIVVLANKNLTTLPRYLSMEVIDRLLNLPSRNWLDVARASLEATAKTSQADFDLSDKYRKPGTSLSHSLEEYVGEYEHPAYGHLRIELQEDGLVATLHGISSRLEHWHYDVFTLTEDLQDLLVERKGIKFSFGMDANGNISEVAASLEQKTANIVFKKKSDRTFFDAAHFKPYIGQYDIYGVTVDITYRNGMLIAMIPGQSNYELEPLGGHEFKVKNDNYLVRFEIGADGLAKEVILVLPFGAYSAERVRSN